MTDMLRRGGFTLLEVALAISLVVTLAVVSYVSLQASQGRVADSGANYSEEYLGTIESLLDDMETPPPAATTTP